MNIRYENDHAKIFELFCAETKQLLLGVFLFIHLSGSEGRDLTSSVLFSCPDWILSSYIHIKVIFIFMYLVYPIKSTVLLFCTVLYVCVVLCCRGDSGVPAEGECVRLALLDHRGQRVSVRGHRWARLLPGTGVRALLCAQLWRHCCLRGLRRPRLRVHDRYTTLLY